MSAQILDGKALAAEIAEIVAEQNPADVDALLALKKDGKTVAVRPEDVAITSEPADIQGCVRTIMVLGHYVEVNVQCGDLVVKCFVDRDQSERLNPGDPVNLKFLKTHIF